MNIPKSIATANNMRCCMWYAYAANRKNVIHAAPHAMMQLRLARLLSLNHLPTSTTSTR